MNHAYKFINAHIAQSQTQFLLLFKLMWDSNEEDSFCICWKPFFQHQNS